MNTRERIVAALHGELPDQVPWTMYGALIGRGEVERKARNRGMGLVSHAAVYSAERPNVRLVERSVVERGETVYVRTYQTPVGEVTEKRKVEPGYNSSWAFEHFVKEPQDYEVLEFIIRDTVYAPDCTSFLRTEAEMGTDGIVNTLVSRMPFQRLWVEYTGLDRLLLDLHDHPGLVERVLGAMLEKDREMWAIVAESSSEFVWAPDNVTALVMGPRLFDRYFAPYYEALCATMHRVGKRVYCHADGATRALVDNIARLPIDIVEAFTPEPTGDLSLAEARRAWPDKVLWINFPSSVFVEPPAEVARATRELLRQAAPGGGFLLGITENVPDDKLPESLDAIGEVLDEVGRCPLSG
jgi:hypothetical protein